NSMVGDGFGGRLWYKPYNYTVGSYSAYTICGDDHQLYGWGSNEKGQLGVIGMGGAIAPVTVMRMDNVKFYSTGYCMAAIKWDSSGWVWGEPLQPIPRRVIEGVIFADAGMYSAAFVKADGTVWSVGNNRHGQFGNDSKETSNVYHSGMYTPQQMI